MREISSETFLVYGRKARLNLIHLLIELDMICIGNGVWSYVISRFVELFWWGVILRLVYIAAVIIYAFFELS